MGQNSIVLNALWEYLGYLDCSHPISCSFNACVILHLNFATIIPVYVSNQLLNYFRYGKLYK